MRNPRLYLLFIPEKRKDDAIHHNTYTTARLIGGPIASNSRLIQVLLDQLRALVVLLIITYHLHLAHHYR